MPEVYNDDNNINNKSLYHDFNNDDDDKIKISYFNVSKTVTPVPISTFSFKRISNLLIKPLRNSVERICRVATKSSYKFIIFC